MSVVSITKESLPEFLAGNGTIGTSEGKISPVSFPIRKHVVIRADKDNSGTIRVGRPGNPVYVLGPGEEVTLYADQTDKIGVVGSAANQAFNWVAA